MPRDPGGNYAKNKPYIHLSFDSIFMYCIPLLSGFCPGDRTIPASAAIRAPGTASAAIRAPGTAGTAGTASAARRNTEQYSPEQRTFFQFQDTRYQTEHRHTKYTDPF